jgi:anti-sigma factor RsiW
MTNRTERGPVAHAGHDALLIAQYAADDLDPSERGVAEQLVAECAGCAQLAADLRLIARATAELPEPARPREFTLTPDQAARLRRHGWRGLLGGLGLGWVRTDVGRTLAAGLTTLGLAGLLIGVVPGQLAMSGGAAPLQAIGKSVTDASGQGASGAGNEAGQPAAPSARGQYQPAASAAASGAPQPPASNGENLGSEPVGISGERPASSSDTFAAAPSQAPDATNGLRDGAPASGGPNYLIIGSLAAFGLGLGLFAVRRLGSQTGA